jgi:YidC/Oxa1 family membrane protein insertase
VNTGEKVEHLDPKDEYQRIGSTVRWAGVENNYFLAIFIPSSATSQPADSFMTKVSGDKKPQNVNVILAGVRPEPLQMTLFIGPKDYILLGELGMDLKKAVDFGFFAPITKALFFTLREFYRFTTNYGWAIVLITILIKIIFTPFTQMSFASMKKMQQMQPEMKKIQEKYAKMKSDDPRKQSMNTEVMALHKRYGVNPLGGCLPMLLQMPVLFAFYQLLSNAIELRGAPFGLWLQDLSRPDPYWVSPLLMGATMFLQQKMTPATDPMQKNMMYIMPIMFTYISLNLPSGLVLYWLLSNVLAIAHQYYFQQQQQKAIPAVVKAT